MVYNVNNCNINIEVKINFQRIREGKIISIRKDRDDLLEI